MVVGWQTAAHMRTALVTDALKMAFDAGHVDVDVDAIFHADRGTQYTSAEFGAFTAKNSIRRSLGRTGVWLTAVAGVVAALTAPVRDAWTSTVRFRTRVAAAASRLRRWDEQRLAPLQTARDVAAAEVATLEAELRDLTVAGQLAGLAARRAGDADYRAQLGLMTRIREDFEEMARLLLAADNDPVR